VAALSVKLAERVIESLSSQGEKAGGQLGEVRSTTCLCLDEGW
jgi:hypothetical protein